MPSIPHRGARLALYATTVAIAATYLVSAESASKMSVGTMCVNGICTPGRLIKVGVIRLPRTGLHLLLHRLHHETAETRDAARLRPSAVPLLHFGPPHSPLKFIRKTK